MSDYDLTVKIILLGDYTVDKAKLLRALKALPKEQEVMFLGARSGVVEMLFIRKGKRIRAKISDTAGQERFRSITSSFYRGAHGCLLVFDVTQKATFESLNDWQQELHRNTIADDIVVTLAGCNCHVASSERQVAKKAAQEFAEYLGIPYEEVSIKLVGTLVKTLEDVVDRIVLMASRMPVLSDSIKPLEQRLEEKQQQQLVKRRHCACWY
ncbi:ras-related protein Rab-1B-like [Littorina saxatilis]|uniref:Uncharacterized protein n=1 Tax=Littorina saxatilis TaxID=31220 RepID=A0AAN9FYI9_9CAEN